MKAGLALALSLVILAACDTRQSSLSAPTVGNATSAASRFDDPPFCGGKLKPGAATAYFQELKAALETGEPVPMAFYATRIGIMSDGRYLTFRRKDFGPGAHALLSRDQWLEILDRGVEDLESAGWRGCILADGKAGFATTADGELVLTSFDKDRAWVASHRNM